jgi:GAF domain-containing protein
VLNLEAHRKSHFTADDQATAEMLAPTIAAVLKQLIGQQERDELATRVTTLSETYGAVLTARDEGSFFRELAQRIPALFPEVDLCVARVLDPDWSLLLLRGVGYRPGIQIVPTIEEIGFDLPVVGSITGNAVRSSSILEHDLLRATDFHRRELATRLNLLGMAAVSIPGVDEAQPLGSLSIYATREEYPLHQAHLRTLEGIAKFVALALSNLRSAQKGRVINETTRISRVGAASESTLNRIAQLVCDMIVAKAASIFLWNGSQFTPKASTADIPRSNQRSYQPGEGKTGFVGATGKPMRVASRQLDEKLRQLFPGCRETHKWSEVEPKDGRKLSFLAVPILDRNDHVLGVIRALGRSDRLPFGPAEQETLIELADHLALALESEKVVGRPIS